MTPLQVVKQIAKGFLYIVVAAVIIAALFVLVLGVFAGCAATTAGVAVAPAAVTENPAERLAQRLLETPGQVAEVGGVIYAVGVGESRDMQFALNRGENIARANVTQFVSGGGRVSVALLGGVRIEWRKVVKDGAQYRATVLMTMPSPPASPQEEGMIMPQ